MQKEKQKRVEYSSRFIKQFKKAPLKISIAFRTRFNLFKTDPFSEELKNHQLTGKLKGYRSINVTGDWRALYIETNDVIVFEFLGTHSQLYK